MGNHSPMPSSVSNCTKPLIDGLACAGFEIDIVTDRKAPCILKNEKIGDVNVHRIDDHRTMAIILLNELKKIHLPKGLQAVTKFFVNVLKALCYIRFYSRESEKEFSGWPAEQVIAYCMELDKKQNYAAILSISLPFKPHLIAQDFINRLQRPIKWFVFEFDPYTYNETVTLTKRKHNKLLAQEKNVFEQCDQLFLTPELYKFYENTPLKGYLEKATAINFANMKKNDEPATVEHKIEFDPGCINALFAGRLYADIRNPFYAFEVFRKVEQSICLFLLTNLDGFEDEDVQKNMSLYQERFSIYPFQPRDTTLQALSEADILVNIGNTVISQVPGKIFEYMATGKPIIHFAKRQDDPACVYLSYYPMVLIVKEWEKRMDEDALAVSEFCAKHNGEQLTYEEVCQYLSSFASEEVTAFFVEKFQDALKGQDGT